MNSYIQYFLRARLQFITLPTSMAQQRSLFSFGVSVDKKRKHVDQEVEILSANADENISQPGKKQKTELKQRNFQAEWLKQFPWLEFQADSKRMFCSYCRAVNNQNSFTKEGAGQ